MGAAKIMMKTETKESDLEHGMMAKHLVKAMFQNITVWELKKKEIKLLQRQHLYLGISGLDQAELTQVNVD